MYTSVSLKNIALNLNIIHITSKIPMFKKVIYFIFPIPEYLRNV